jgi:CDP-diacylglycerol--serine O-phosphatidyltransferase
VTCAALRLARFNIQHGHTDKRYFVGLASPAAAAVLASTVFYYPVGLQTRPEAWLGVILVLVPALLMVSTIRFYSFKTLDLRERRRYTVLIAFAAFLALIVAFPHEVLLIMAYGYLLSGPVGIAINRFRHRAHGADPQPPSSAASA